MENTDNNNTQTVKTNKYAMKSKKYELVKKNQNDLNKSNVSEIDTLDLNKIKEAM